MRALTSPSWRVGRTWSPEELEKRLRCLSSLERNYEESDRDGRGNDWGEHRSRSRIGSAPPGPPRGDGPFARGRKAVSQFAFSDPSIVEAHFRADAPLLERRMLLELKPLIFRYLCGVVVVAVRDETRQGGSTFGFRYDTLEGHLERGSEWFVLEKNHESGALTFEIEATWRTADFPNWWSRAGFAVVGKHYQRRWHEAAHRRMSAFVRGASVPGLAGRGDLTHQGPKVVFERGSRE